jgi:hypothetical protein
MTNHKVGQDGQTYHGMAVPASVPTGETGTYRSMMRAAKWWAENRTPEEADAHYARIKRQMLTNHPRRRKAPITLAKIGGGE